MSKVKNKKLKRLGISTKSQKRKARKYIIGFVKCNKIYGYNNIAFHFGKLNTFATYSSSL